MQRKQGKNLITWALLFCCVPLVMYYPRLFGARRYYLAATLMCLLSMGRLFTSFERSGPGVLKIQLIAVMSALAVAGRAVFAGVPFVKPVAALVILAGAMLGPQAGFVRGAVTMLVSNFMFSQGPWTLWQMLSFGVCGLLAGLVFYKHDKIRKRLPMAVFGFVEYLFITGPILDISGIFTYSMGHKMKVAALLLSGFSVNLVAAASTFVFLMILAEPIMKKLKRITVKYGL